VTRTTGRRIAWATIALSILLVLYCYSGIVMVGSFSVSNPERIENYQLAAKIYTGLIACGLLTIVGAGIYLVRSGAVNADRPAT
jgi:uncharacterized membrane protein YjfL (UPF0719 family)